MKEIIEGIIVLLVLAIIIYLAYVIANSTGITYIVGVFGGVIGMVYMLGGEAND